MNSSLTGFDLVYQNSQRPKKSEKDSQSSNEQFIESVEKARELYKQIVNSELDIYEQRQKKQADEVRDLRKPQPKVSKSH